MNTSWSVSNSQTSPCEKRETFGQRIVRACWEPAFCTVSLLKPLAIVIQCDDKEREDRVYFRDPICHWDPHRVSSMLEVRLTSYVPPASWSEGNWAPRREQEKKRCHVCLVVPRFMEENKCIRDPFQKIKAAPARRTEQAGKCIWLLPGLVCIFKLHRHLGLFQPEPGCQMSILIICHGCIFLN